MAAGLTSSTLLISHALPARANCGLLVNKVAHCRSFQSLVCVTALAIEAIYSKLHYL
jgi:hypothetical protein